MAETIQAVVLAAGKGTRLQTEGIDLPKVLREADGKPLLHYVLKSLDFLPKEDTILVVGWMGDKVRARFPDYPSVEQEVLNGTGGAVRYAAPLLTDPDSHVLICCGDTPLMRRETFESLIRTHLESGCACTMLSAHLEEGGNYGRIVRNPDGTFAAIVEAKDCTPEQAAITEVNVATYVFRVGDLLAWLDKLTTDNAQGEYYLTDVPALIAQAGGKVALCDTCSPLEMLGVNTVEQLQQVEDVLRKGW